MLTLLCCCLLIQGPEPTVIPAPRQALAFLGNAGGYPNPAGTYEVAYTLVDTQDRHSDRSPSTTFTAGKGWRVVVNPVGLAKDNPAVAVCYWWKDDGIWRVFGGPVFCENPAGVTRPYFPLAGWQYYWAQGHVLEPTVLAEFNWNKYWWPVWSETFWKKSSTIPAPAQAPSIRVYDAPLPVAECQVAYSWACNEGETALSPVTQVPAGPGRQSIDLARNVIPPNGALGMYVYLRGDDKKWHRQPVPHVVKPSPDKLDDFLWRIDSNIVTVRQFIATGISPSGGPGKSYLSEIHRKIDGGAGHVVLTGNQTIYCPVIMPQSNAYGDSMFRTVGLLNGGMWRLKTALKPGSPTAWPVWLETSQYTRLVGCWMESPTAIAGVAFCDCGSGAYHFRSERLRIGLTGPGSAGIIATSESRGPNGHSCSEPIFQDTEIGAKFPVVVEWSQSANWNFEYLTANSTGEFDSAIVTQSNSGFINFRGRLTADNARALFAVTTANRVDAENIFCDQGMPEWFVLGYRASPVIDVMVKGMNVRIPWLHLVTQISPNENAATVRIRGTNSEPCSDVTNFTTRLGGIRFTGEPSPAVKALVTVQPAMVEWQGTRYWQEWDKGGIVAPPPAVIVQP